MKTEIPAILPGASPWRGHKGESVLTPPPQLDPARYALFLDLDGTLAPFADTPDGVLADPMRTTVLRSLTQKLSGAVAVLTGRTLEDVDRILEGAVEQVAAVHGLVRRLEGGELMSVTPAAELAHARTSLEAMANGQEGLIVEDKDLSVAFHYRQKPEARDRVRDAASRLAQATGLVLQEGAMVAELRTAGPNKGDSLKAFMLEPAFAGRTPIAVGDDLTDEDAFAAAAELGGYGLLVGPERPTNARHRLESVDAVLAWLSVEAIY